MIYEEVALSLQKAGMPEEKVRQKVEDTLKICGLYPFRNWPVSALSFGQKKRVDDCKCTGAGSGTDHSG